MDYRTLLSRHRTPLMGLAALLIVCYHSEYTAGPFPIGAICRHGQVGVDMFVFLMGFGLAHALHRRPGFREYWARRLRRLLPAYYVWLVIMTCAAAGMALVMHWRGDFGHWLALHILPVGIWLNREPDAWYVSAALGFYAIAPLIYWMLERARHTRAAATALALLLGIVLPAVSHMDGAEIAVMRFSAMVIGLAVGIEVQRVAENPLHRWAGLGWLGVAALVGLCLPHMRALPLVGDLSDRQLYRLGLDWLAPLLCVMLAAGLEVLSRTPLRALNRMLNALGECSLEIYLIHVTLNALIRDYLHLPSPLVLALLIALCWPLARIVRWLERFPLAAWKAIRRAGQASNSRQECRDTSRK